MFYRLSERSLQNDVLNSNPQILHAKKKPGGGLVKYVREILPPMSLLTPQCTVASLWLCGVLQGKHCLPWLNPYIPGLFRIDSSFSLRNTCSSHRTLYLLPILEWGFKNPYSLKISHFHSGPSVVPGLFVYKWVFLVNVMGVMIPWISF